MTRIKLYIGLAFMLVVAAVAFAAIPQVINYQGLLTDAGGTPVANSSYSVTFTIYTASSGGSVLWTETKSVTTSSGLFSTLLGSVTPIPDSAFASESSYLGIKVSTDPEISPRQQLASVPYANRVGSLMGATGPISIDTSSDTTFIPPNFMGDGSEELQVPCTFLPVSPPFSNLNVGGGLFSGRMFVRRNATFGNAWTIFGEGSTGDFYAKGKGTFGSNHFNNGFYSFVAGCSNIITSGTQYATIPGGFQNTVSGNYTVIGGGENNSAGGVDATINGGLANSASNNFTSVGGGSFNSASGLSATVGGGFANASSGQNATIGGGSTNSASMFGSTIAGGDSNGVTQVWGSIGGGQSNRLNSQWGTISGGQNNGISSGLHSAIGGGLGNLIVNNINASVIAGGASNNVSNHWSAIGGGTGNLVPGRYAIVGGGQTNTAGDISNGSIGWWTTVSGGNANTASENYATIGGGQNNLVNSEWSTIGGGTGNLNSGKYCTIGGGQNNIVGISAAGTAGWWTVVSGGLLNEASGDYSTVPGGVNNTASGISSFAAGTQAKAIDNCSFVWSDCCPAPGNDFYSMGANTFSIRAGGGTYIFSKCDTSSGVALLPGASAWSAVSDSTKKRNIRQVDGNDILEKLSQLPVSRWSYKAQSAAIEHIGPMAQDFYRVFGLGEDDKLISTIDPDGVALAAAKALYKLNLELQDKVSTQQQTIDKLQQKTAEIDKLKDQLALMSDQLTKLLAAQSKSTGNTKLAINDKTNQTGGK